MVGYLNQEMKKSCCLVNLGKRTRKEARKIKPRSSPRHIMVFLKDLAKRPPGNSSSQEKEKRETKEK